LNVRSICLRIRQTMINYLWTRRLAIIFTRVRKTAFVLSAWGIPWRIKRDKICSLATHLECNRCGDAESAATVSSRGESDTESSCADASGDNQCRWQVAARSTQPKFPTDQSGNAAGKVSFFFILHLLSIFSLSRRARISVTQQLFSIRSDWLDKWAFLEAIPGSSTWRL
jgi:hypothetical protein